MVFPHRARDNRLKKCELSGGVEAIADQAKRTAGRHRHVIHSRALRVPRERRNQNKSSPPMADCFYFGDPYGTRTHVTAVKGRCLNHLTNGPEKRHIYMCLYGSGTWIRTGDTSGMNRMLWPTELCRHMLFKQHRDSIRRHARCQQIFCVWGKFFTRISPPLRQRDTPRDRRARR